MAEVAIAWLLTFLLHSTLLVLAALAVERLVAGRAPRVVDLGFKLALTGGLLTATLALALPGPTRLRFDLGADGPRAADPVASAASVSPATVAGEPARRGPGAGAVAASSGPSLTGPTAPPARPATAVDWRVVAVGLWLLGVGVALVAPWRAARRLRRLLVGRRAIAGPLAARLVADAARAGLRAPVALSTSVHLPVPIARGWRRPEVVLPAALVRELPAGELAAVLAHELAHLVRRDPAWLHLGALLRALLWPQPLLALALRRWRENAELVCDDWAAACLGQRAVLARCLARVAGALSRPVAPVLAPGMAGEGARVVGRVRRLLAPPADEAPSGLGYARAGVIAVALTLTALGPAVLPATGRIAGDPAAEAEGTSSRREHDATAAPRAARWRAPRPTQPVPPVAPVPPVVAWVVPAAPPAPALPSAPALAPVPPAVVWMTPDPPPAPALPAAPALAPVPPVPPVPPVARSGGGGCWYVPDDGEPFAVDCDDLEAGAAGAPWAAARELAALPGLAEEARRIAESVEAELAERLAAEQARLHQQHDLLRRDRERVVRELARVERDRARGARVLIVPERLGDHVEDEVAASLETALSALEDALETLPAAAGSELERELERELARLAEQLEASAERLAAARDRRGRVP